jgi:hypothetical protein
MNLPVDQRIDEAHAEAERIESEARQVEARIIAAGGIPPLRQYGRPVSSEAVAQNLTLKSLLQRRDPALASYLGVGSDITRREAEAAAARQLQAEAMRLQTERLRQVNTASGRYREQMSNAGINPSTGRAWGC